MGPRNLYRPSLQRENPLIPYLSLTPEDEGSYPGAFSPFIAVDEGNTTPRFMRPTLRLVPSCRRALRDTSIPFAIEVVPMARPQEGESLPCTVYDPSPPQQCQRCMAYVNCFVVFERLGWVWNCNLCGFSNEVGAKYFAPLYSSGERSDRSSRPELCHGTVDWLLPSKDCLVLPLSKRSSGHHSSHQRVVFCIDMSSAALQSGYTVVSLDAIRSSLSSMLECTPHLNVGIVTFDEGFRVSFYYLQTIEDGGGLKGESVRCMRVATAVDAVQSPFSPIPARLWLQPCHSKGLSEIVTFMYELILKEEETVKSNQHPIDVLTLTCASVAAVSCAADALSECGGGHVVLLVGPAFTSVGLGGKMMFRSSPSLDDIRLKLRVTEFCAKQVGVDIIVAWSSVYFEKSRSICDNKVCSSRDAAASTASLPPRTEAIRAFSYLSRGTGGRICTLKWEMDIFPRLKAIIDQCVFRTKSMEVDVKVQCSTGFKCTSMYGPGLPAAHDPSQRQLAIADSDTTFVCELEHEVSDVLKKDVMNRKAMYVQVSVHYTTSEGLRKVRLHNMIIPFASSVERFYNAVDASSMCICMLRLNILHAMDKTGGCSTPADMYSALEFVAECCVTIMTHYKKSCSTNTTSLNQSDPLSLLPLLVLCMKKCIAFRCNCEPDSALALNRLMRSPLNQLLQELYPSLFVMKLSDITGDEDSSWVPPPNILTRHPPSAQHIGWNGLSLLVVPPLYAFLFVSEKLDEEIRLRLLERAPRDIYTGQKLLLKKTGLEVSRIRMWMKYCVESLQFSTATSSVDSKTVKGDPFTFFFFDVVLSCPGKSNQDLFYSLLVEDRTNEGLSYYEYVAEVVNGIDTKLES